MDIRTYKDQFGSNDIRKIEFIFNLLNKLKKNKKFLNFYCVELRCSLIGGSVLGALLITFSILEMFLLEACSLLDIDQAEDYDAKILNFEKNKTNISKFLEILDKHKVIDSNDIKKINDIYQKYRIPLSHGLRTKGIYDFAKSRLFFQTLFNPENKPYAVVSRDMEDILEESGLDLIIEILILLIKLCK